MGWNFRWKDPPPPTIVVRKLLILSNVNSKFFVLSQSTHVTDTILTTATCGKN